MSLLGSFNRMLYPMYILFLLAPALGHSQANNLLPMYGPSVKNEKQLQADEKFFAEVIEQFGTKKAGASQYLNLAWNHLSKGDYKTAMKRFNQAWMLDSKLSEVYFGFYLLPKFNAGFNYKAQPYFLKGRSYDNNFMSESNAYQRSADCAEQLEKNKLVIYFYTELIKLNPKNAYFYKKRGYFHSKLNNSTAALSDYAKALELDPIDANTYNNRGFRYQINQHYDLAIADYTKAFALDSFSIKPLVNRSIVYAIQGKYKLAYEDVLTCIARDPNHGPFYTQKGSLEIQLGKQKQACISFNKAASLSATGAEALLSKYCNNKGTRKRK